MGKKAFFLSSVSAVVLAVAFPSFAGGLPTGARYEHSIIKITTAANSMTVKQSSTTGVIDWKSFSIGAGNSVQFNNGAGATLNQVTGKNLSTIAGTLHATGTIYLTNASGVIVSSTGKIVTNGTFIASSGQFSGAFDTNIWLTDAEKTVTNKGSITSKKGDVALVGGSVVNDGTLTASKGFAGLAAGQTDTVRSSTSLPEPMSVSQGSGSATNAGKMTGSQIDIASAGGNATVSSGTVTAVGSTADNAQIWLLATNGKLTLAGALKATNPDGTGGTIDADAAHLALGGIIHVGKTGIFDIMAPNGFEISSAAGIDSVLNDGTNITIDSANTGGADDIVIDAPLSWKSKATLTIDSDRAIIFNQPVTVKGGGGIALITDDAGYGGSGSDYIFENGASMGFGSTNEGSTFSVNGTDYTLVYSMKQLQNINENLSGSYALAISLDAAKVTQWNPIGLDGAGNIIGEGFTGMFDGLGHTISNLTIDLPNTQYVGLFAELGQGSGPALGAGVRDIGLVGGSVTGKFDVGGIVGEILPGTYGVQYSYNTGTVTGFSYVGGLVGDNWDTVADSYATGNVTCTGGDQCAGGLVGYNIGLVIDSYATGNVSGADTIPGCAGGLVGCNAGAVEDSYSTGTVTGATTNGGAIGANATGDPNLNISDVYWDTTTSGLTTSASGTTGLTTKQLEHALPTGLSSAVWGIDPKTSMPYLLWQAPGTGTRPSTANAVAPDDLLKSETKHWRG
jgi:filamentous hemagglutinin family protein